MKTQFWIAALCGAWAVAAVACGGGSSDASGFPGSGSPANLGGGGSTAGTTGATGGGNTGTNGTTAAGVGNGAPVMTVPALPPETKTEGNYQSPVATGRFVWIANPTSGRVAYIDAQSFVVQTVAAGNGPTYLAAVADPTDDVAIVQNVISQDATLLRNKQGTLSTATFPSTADANSWAVSPSGRWAIAWTDASRITNPDPTQGFQDLAVIDTSGTRSAILAVGFRPVKVAFSSDDKNAYAVTQDGISVIDLLSGMHPSVTQQLMLAAPPSADGGAPADAGTSADSSSDTGADAGEGGSSVPPPTPMNGPPPSGTPDVSFTSDGSYALVRIDGQATINVISLKTGQSTAVTLPALPTDLTVSPASDFAVAALRSSSSVAILPLPGIATNPSSFDVIPVGGSTIGRAVITKDGGSVLLFTTAAPVDELTVLALKPTPMSHTVTLRAPVRAVFPTDDAKNAVVLHNVTPVPGDTVRGAFSLVPIAGSLPAKIVSLPAAPMAVALAPTSDRALVTMRDDLTGTFGVDLAMLPSFEVVTTTLASPPIAVGIAAGTTPARGYVAQDYSEGRITFLDLAGGATRTITGFELASRIVEGTQ
jgi:hypothetical protein